MTSPQVNSRYFTERVGVIKVASIINEMRCIWREKPINDIGIDGQIEYLNESGQATGHFIAVQVKSGKAYLKGKNEYINFRPQVKHKKYWENFPIPVLIIIYDPDQQTAYWEDARRYLRANPSTNIISIPKKQLFLVSQKAAIFESCGTPDQKLLPTKELLIQLFHNKHQNSSLSISFFELFASGLTDMDDKGVCRKLFFSFGLFMKHVHSYALLHNREQNSDGTQSLRITLGVEESEFIDKYVRFIVNQNLAIVDFSDYLTHLFLSIGSGAI